MKLEITDVKELVETVMYDLYTPHVYITEDNTLLLTIGYDKRGTITLDEFKEAGASCGDFIDLVKNKVENGKTT